jgi:mono/diheme cytochrome c family protein
MKTTSLNRMLPGLLPIVVTGLILAGCASPESKSDSKIKSAAEPASGSVAGAQMWAQNCGHCHNIRSPSSYSDAQWDVVMLHMRIRANLTPKEHQAILAFLKSAH